VIKRILVEKRPGFNTEAVSLKETFKTILGIEAIQQVRVIFRYDVDDLNDDVLERVKNTIFSEPNVDVVYNDEVEIDNSEKVFAIEYLPGQYDQLADSALQCIQILAHHRALIKVAKLIIIKGDVKEDSIKKIKQYMINPVDSREADLNLKETLEVQISQPANIEIIQGLINFTPVQLEEYRVKMGFAMSTNDFIFVQEYFKNEEKRDPFITELKVIDTYWSDHCRHTTFSTQLQAIDFERGPINTYVEKVFKNYDQTRGMLYGENTERPITLMDLATLATKDLKKRGLLPQLDESEEINACSIKIKVDHDGQDEDWLLMFKNETHNHPTEIEPFGGAATCLGGAIRDPLSGRSYVYQAMRVTGSGDPRVPLDQTLPGKLPQRKISTEAALGYSSYGNQIGLATGQVHEIYDAGFIAKRMEVGAVIAAVPEKNVRRERPEKGDCILLVGGKTGRDGCGGATGSSKAHTENSIHKSGSEVQKGNPVEERKIQRLFRNPEIAQMIKRCNDFGAGGVSVAIGELADSLIIDLDQVPKKYEGLDGTELAISESQERMAVVVEPSDVDAFIALGRSENLEVTKVAEVTDDGRLTMTWRGQTILDLSRAFLNTNGAPQFANVLVKEPIEEQKENTFTGRFLEELSRQLSHLNSASQKGLSEMFDSTIGTGTITMPYGGKYSLTPQEGMAAKIPVEHGVTNTCSIMTYGCTPEISKWSPFHGGAYAVIESIAKLVAMGGDFRKTHLSFQEYFERLNDVPEKWGKPFTALLGAFEAQIAMGTPAIGGKDSMSGTFEDKTVPPTLISFAVTSDTVDHIVTSELKQSNSKVYLFKAEKDEHGFFNYEQLREMYENIHQLICEGKILAASVVGNQGIASAIAKMSFGNKIGLTIDASIDQAVLFEENYGSILVETQEDLEALLIAKTTEKAVLKYAEEEMQLNALIELWEAPLHSVYPAEKSSDESVITLSNEQSVPSVYTGKAFAAPKVFIPIFPGTNCEYDTVRAFEKAGALTETVVFRNQNSQDITDSIADMVKAIQSSQMIMIPGGFSAGDQPNGSGKFIATVFRNPAMTEAVMTLLKEKDGLMLGICNGFQALIKLGLVPYGEICDIKPGMPTLTYNTIGRHVSTIPMTQIVSRKSPWLAGTAIGDIYRIPMSHGEGRFVADDATIHSLIENDQIATQYVDFNGKATMDGHFNPNGSTLAIEGICSKDGHILGKMGHSERLGKDLYKNIPGQRDQKIFESGVNYFK